MARHPRQHCTGQGQHTHIYSNNSEERNEQRRRQSVMLLTDLPGRCGLVVWHSLVSSECVYLLCYIVTGGLAELHIVPGGRQSAYYSYNLT